jgi:hypothetical protein
MARPFHTKYDSFFQLHMLSQPARARKKSVVGRILSYSVNVAYTAKQQS